MLVSKSLKYDFYITTITTSSGVLFIIEWFLLARGKNTDSFYSCSMFNDFLIDLFAGGIILYVISFVFSLKCNVGSSGVIAKTIGAPIERFIMRISFVIF